MKSNRNVFILFMSALLVIILMASTSALIMSGMSDDPVMISVIVDDSSSGRWASFQAGLEQAAKDRGVKLSIVPTSRNLTVNQQYLITNDCIADGADGIILQFAGSRGTENMISSISSKAVLVLADTSADMDVDIEGKSACIEADNIEIGRALANEVRLALGKELSSSTIGIVAGNQKQNSIRQRLEGFSENLEGSGAEIVWTESSIINVSDKIEKRQEGRWADVIVALENAGLEAACEYALNLESAPLLFGEGTSIKNVSYLDDGLIKSMIVPNEYYMGYQSVTAITRRLDNRITPMENETIGFRVVNRENLFDEANQRMLFPVVE